MALRRLGPLRRDSETLDVDWSAHDSTETDRRHDVSSLIRSAVAYPQRGNAMRSPVLLAEARERDRHRAIHAFCSRTGLMIASLSLAMPVAAQAPGSATTAFDGTYVGISREYSWAANPTPGNTAKCGQNGVPFPPTITNGVVRSTPDYWEGTVNPLGSVVMRNGSRVLTAQIDNLDTIRGQRSGTDCATAWVWRKQSG
jgi:hypothetical protein